MAPTGVYCEVSLVISALIFIGAELKKELLRFETSLQSILSQEMSQKVQNVFGHLASTEFQQYARCVKADFEVYTGFMLPFVVYWFEGHILAIVLFW